MDSSKPSEPAEQDDVNALETAEGSTSVDGVNQTIDATSSDNANAPTAPTPAKKPGGVRAKLRQFNVYLLLMGLILTIAGGILTVAYFQSKQATTTNTIKDQDLTEETLREIAKSDASVGSSQQVLNVQSSAVFAGKVLVRDGLEVASNLQVGGTTALTDLTVAGTSQFGQVQVDKDLGVTGNVAAQGALTARSLQISGGGTFSGPVSAPQITTPSLQLNGDLVLTNHIVAGGPTPGATPGPAVGGGGSASVSGSDTSGTVNINVGGGAPAGCFATINFTRKYNATPHVTVTPVGANAGSLDYYVTRNTASFSICDATAPPAGISFAFDYFIVE